MTENLVERHYRDRVQSVRKLVPLPDWEGAVLSQHDVADLVALCCELSQSARDLMDGEFVRIFGQAGLTVAWLQERRQAIVELTDRYMEMADTIRATVSAGQGTGIPNGHDFVKDVEKAIQGVLEAKRSFLDRWLVGSPEEMAEVKAAIARGETLDAEEAFAEIAGADVQTWRKNVGDVGAVTRISPDGLGERAWSAQICLPASIRLSTQLNPQT